MLILTDPKNDYAFKAVFGSPQHVTCGCTC